MIHRVRCVARCDHAGPAESVVAVLRLCPRASPHQRVRACDLRVAPRAAVVREGTDHFGNPVAWLLSDPSHAGFEAVAEAVVEVSAPAMPDPFATPAWEAVARAGSLAHGAAEFAFGSPLAPVGEAARAYAAPSFPPGFPVLAGLLDLLGRIGRDVRLRPGGAEAPAGVDDTLRLRAGDAREVSHLMIAAVRGVGLPACHVSGCAGARGVGRLHAWAECWLGPRHGWLGLDPSHDRVAADGHVVFARGRDAADVDPARVAVPGGGAHAIGVDVHVEACTGGGARGGA